MQRATHFARERFEKNWPALRCAIGGGFNRFVLAARPQPLDDAVPVFCYHVITAEALAEDLQFLKDNHYTTLSADALLDHMLGRRRAPARSVVLSFDDGSANLYWAAFPVLRAYDMQAVAFICPGLHAETPSEHTPAGPNNNWTTDLCTWPQIVQMHHSGHIDVQSHTLEHRHLRRWPQPVVLAGCSPEVEQPRRRAAALPLQEDFMLARRMLERRLNKTVQHLAFPRLQGTAAALDAGRACGYTAFWGGVTLTRSDNRPGDPPTEITRLNADMIYRLPGKGRKTLVDLATRRAAQRLRPKPPAPTRIGIDT